MNQNFLNFMGNYAETKMAVAVSGGVDSICLLYWLAEMRLDLVVLHVNHGLRAMAQTESDYVRVTSEKLNIPCVILNWDGDKPETGLESAARDARYGLMTDYCRENNIDTLVVAHQADDQIETFLMNLARGSGVYGLAAMRDETFRDGVRILRPLLTTFRRELIEYCDSNNIKYFADEMNEDEKYTRVKIRKNRHVLSDRLGITDNRILHAISNLSRTRDALDLYVATRADSVMRDGYALMDESFLFDEPDEIRLKLLSRLIQKIGGNEYQPRLNSIEKALRMLGKDAKFTLGRCTLRKLRSDILIVPEGESISFRKRK